MKKIKSSLLLIVLFAGIAVGDGTERTLDLHTLSSDYFDLIQQVGTNLVLKTKTTGRQLNFTSDDESLKANQAGGLINLSVGQKVKLYGRHVSLSIGSLPEEIKSHGFEVKEILDFRSFGDAVKTNIVYLILMDPESTNSGSNTIQCVAPSVQAVKELLGKGDN